MKLIICLLIGVGLYAQEKSPDENVAQEYYLYFGKNLAKRRLLSEGDISAKTIRNEFLVHFLWDGSKVDSITFEGKICNEFIEPITTAVKETSDYWGSSKVGKVWVTVPFFIGNITMVDPKLRSFCNGTTFPSTKSALVHKKLTTPKMEISGIE